eukprot:TRINITY_DN7498_c0_g1_i2.p1 TRINITY_DN7498_c0_g1~~TRINITY_DN7498_c0_g1_i2.p1  ORF type:complete len:509 (+),score=105.53 TRINITY_DN7498_c0_g1_i2:200-1726(+)
MPVQRFAQGLRDRVAEQLAVAQHFLDEDVFRGAIIMIWVASFGSALHAPVTTFYYLALGATELDIGVYGMVTAGGGMLLAPLYGWLLDKSGSFPVMTFSCLLCATGCLIRGVAPNRMWCLAGVFLLGLGGGNLWTATLSHITRHTPESRRSAHLSGYLVQVGTLRILGKSLYPLCDGGLLYFGVHDELLRFRYNMAFCTVFCFYGIFVLIYHRKGLSQEMRAVQSPLAPQQAPRTPATPPDLEGQEVLAEGDLPQSDASPSPEPASPVPKSHKYELMMCGISVCAQSIAATTLTILWPLFLHDQYGWGALEYSYVLFISSVLMTGCVSLAPYLERTQGHLQSAAALCLLTGASALAAFTSPLYTPNAFLSKAVHVCAAMVAMSAVSCLEPVVKSLSSLFALPSSQARAFGGLASAQGVGEMVGSMLGATLYKYGKGTRAGLLPMCLVVCAMLCAVVVFYTLRLPSVSLEAHESGYSDSAFDLPADFDSPVVKNSVSIRHRLRESHTTR